MIDIKNSLSLLGIEKTNKFQIFGVILSPENLIISEIELFFLLSLIGWLGCQVDSLLGALLENRGYLGKHSVNFIATFSGSLMAIFFYYQFL